MERPEPVPAPLPVEVRESILIGPLDPHTEALLAHIAYLESNLEGRDLLIYELAMEMGPRTLEVAAPRLAAIAHHHAEVLEARRNRMMEELPPAMILVAPDAYIPVRPHGAFYDGWIYHPAVTMADYAVPDPDDISPSRPIPRLLSSGTNRQRMLEWAAEYVKGSTDFPLEMASFEEFGAAHPQAERYLCRAVINYAHYKLNPRYPRNKRKRSLVVAIALDGTIGLWPEHRG